MILKLESKYINMNNYPSQIELIYYITYYILFIIYNYNNMIYKFINMILYIQFSYYIKVLLIINKKITK